ncbi:hypothetical protein MMC13_005223 [Lambiella insularis]|nr:hypothetical protein [Lambiella insularis]
MKVYPSDGRATVELVPRRWRMEKEGIHVPIFNLESWWTLALFINIKHNRAHIADLVALESFFTLLEPYVLAFSTLLTFKNSHLPGATDFRTQQAKEYDPTKHGAVNALVSDKKVLRSSSAPLCSSANDFPIASDSLAGQRRSVVRGSAQFHLWVPLQDADILPETGFADYTLKWPYDFSTDGHIARFPVNAELPHRTDGAGRISMRAAWLL